MSDLTQSTEFQEQQNVGFEFINHLAATGIVLWNNGGQLTEHPDLIDSNASTSMSVDFLRNASNLMLEGSCINPPYVLVAPKAEVHRLRIEYLRYDLCHEWAAIHETTELEKNKEKATEIMMSKSSYLRWDGTSIDCIGTTIGKIDNVILVASDYFGVGAPGSLGVQRENVGGQLQVTTSSYLFGSKWLKHGIYPNCIELRTTAVQR